MQAFIYAKNTDNLDNFSDMIKVCKSLCNDFQLICENKRSFRELENLKRKLSDNDIVIINSLAALGLSDAQKATQLEWFINNAKLLIIKSIPSTYEYNIGQPINQAVLKTVLQSVLGSSNNIAIMPKKNNSGRNRVAFPDNWDELYAKWENKEISSKQFLEESGLKKATFYNLITEYRELQEINKKYITKYGIS